MLTLDDKILISIMTIFWICVLIIVIGGTLTKLEKAKCYTNSTCVTMNK